MEKLIEIIKSSIWVNNPILIDAIYRRLVFYNRLDFITPEFWGVTINSGIPFEHEFNATDLQLLVDSELWVDEPQVLWFIFDQSVKLPKAQFRSFGSPKFWDCILQEPSVNFTPIVAKNQIQVGGGPVRDSVRSALEHQDIRNHYQLGEMSRIKVRHFGTEAAQYCVDFQQLDKVKNLHELIPLVFDDILKRVLGYPYGTGHQDDMIGIEINHADLAARPILIPFRKRKDLDVENILQAFEAVSQSKRGLSIDESFYIRVTIVNSQETQS